ncbi:ImmA/IrrE family metallo-endopeptidase [Gordonia humi]|uniref:Phenylpyruvate tautomerase PptA (4-oxalocrotonate tautomerase family) n=1 Tax=Gordonia humi TaxID=686429 RepID=A0A840ETY7_9ACTN|nr:ImmA/IrrE family metallo-endopeptidase [Gordonia humi]MBB4133743.1 phenylpyruvate tautomerase PptA (4-oxalocrotonate tautomerase family) [Gordonia humi]
MTNSAEAPRGARRSHRRVHAAVDAVLDVAAQKQAGSLEDIVRAVGDARRRPITVIVDDLAPGVWGQRRGFDDYDEIVLARSLPSEARTLAHELGHIVFGHTGAPADDATVAVEDDLIAYMLGTAADDPDDTGPQLTPEEHELQEWEAEAFAARLLQRLRQLHRRHSLRPMLRYDEALG